MKILDVKYDNIKLNNAIEQAISILEKQNKANLFFLNVDCLYKAQKDEQYRRILNSADLILPDGIGLKLVTMVFGGRMTENCNGSDFASPFMTAAAKKGYKIFFMGGKEGVADKAAENMKKKIQNIRIVGTISGYFDNDVEVINKINNSRADILFVAMGVPLQEKWIVKNRENLNPKLCLGVGALLDYLSGRINRAPKIIRLIYLEWFWRILIEPRRLFKRYIIDDFFCFGAYMLWARLRFWARDLE